MASELLQLPKKTLAFSSLGVNRLAPERMRKDFQFRISALILAFATVAAVVFASINFSKEGQFPVPQDGVLWVEAGTIQAHHVVPGGSAEQAGLKPGDRILSINGHAVISINDLEEQWSQAGAGYVAKYEVSRDETKLDGRMSTLDLTIPVKLGTDSQGK